MFRYFYSAWKPFVFRAFASLLILFSTHESIAQQFMGRGVVISEFAGANDIRDAKNFGANVVRWQMLGWENDATGAGFLGNIYHLHTVILPACQVHGIKVIIDLHYPPGGYTVPTNDPTNHSSWKHRFITMPNHWSNQEFDNSWLAISNICKNQNEVIGYCLCSEPLSTMAEWRARALSTIQKIRANGDQKKILFEMPFGNPDYFKGFIPFKPGQAGQVCYGFHMYHPHRFTHQGTGSYPNNSQLNIQALTHAMRHAIQWKSTWPNREVHCSGFSANRFASGSDLYVRDCIRIFERPNNKFSWTYHAYNEADVWRITPSRELLLRSWFELN